MTVIPPAVTNRLVAVEGKNRHYHIISHLLWCPLGSPSQTPLDWKWLQWLFYLGSLLSKLAVDETNEKPPYDVAKLHY